MKVQSLVDYHIAGATLQQPESYYATMPHLGRMPMEAMLFGFGWVWRPHHLTHMSL